MHPALVSVLLAALSLPAVAASCRYDTAVGQRCELAIDALRPTQGGIGLIQVEDEAATLRRLSATQLAKKIDKKDIPVVQEPDRGWYLVDRHHLTRALWQNGERRVRVRIIGRLDDGAAFWQQMAARHWAWLYDERGQALAGENLPRHVRDLPDYPYRSLAGRLQDDGYYNKNEQVYFVEFAWAAWLGRQLAWAPLTRQNMAQQLQAAAGLACSPAAAALPGYRGSACPP